MRKVIIAVAAAVCLLAGFIAAGAASGQGASTPKAAAAHNLDKKVDD